MASLLAWTLALLVATNVAWSCWYAWRANFWDELAGETFEQIGFSKYTNGCERTVQVSRSRTIDVYWVSDSDPRPPRALYIHPSPSPSPPPLPVVEEALRGWRIRAVRELCGEQASGEHFGRIFGTVGWPNPMLWCAFDLENSPAVYPSTGLDTGLHHDLFDFPRVLPFRPVWSGQIFCAGFWLAIVLLVRGPAGAMRRQVRRWRGRCGHCRYDLRGNVSGVCPECGMRCDISRQAQSRFAVTESDAP